MSSVTDMFDAPEDAMAFDPPIGAWIVWKVMNMGATFSYAATFDAPIGVWDVSSVTNMSYARCSTDIGGWDTSKEMSMYGIVRGV